MQVTRNKLKILEALKATSQFGRTLSRDDLTDKTGINRRHLQGSLGSLVKGDPDPNSLLGEKLIGCCVQDGDRQLHYYITDKGKKVLSKCLEKVSR